MKIACRMFLCLMLVSIWTPLTMAQDKAPDAKAESPEELQRNKVVAEKDSLEAENALAAARVAKELTAQIEETKKLEIQNALLEEKQKAAISALKAEKEMLETQNAKQEEEYKKALAALVAEKNRLVGENELDDAKHQKALAELKFAQDKLVLENGTLKEAQNKQSIEIQMQQEKLNADLSELNFEKTKTDIELANYQMAKMKLDTDIQLRDQKEKWKSEVNHDLEYPLQPFTNGLLTISDRRIPLNGVIMEGTAEFIGKRIDYFNNQSSEQPIFIVIDSCPGGSVMEGYRIIKTMEASKAPIHVVLKSFAASMAATILTVADHSYAYPNAIILHHQPWSVSWGNLTQQKEQLDIFKEWAQRLHTPVAKKMGITLDEFYKRMYEKNSEGDWQEFADKAKDLKWVDNIVDTIREEGVTKAPDSVMPEPSTVVLAAGKTEPDPVPQNFIRLPRPEPFDFYFLYNPDGRYRW